MISEAFTKTVRNYANRVHQRAEPLDEAQFWSKPFPFGNSFGHLVLHLTGNLNYYIGTVIANSGYIRNRELEFTEPSPPSKAEALAGFETTIQMVIETIAIQKPEDWSKPYAAIGMPDGLNRFEAVLQCTAHIYHHVGQMIYLQKSLV